MICIKCKRRIDHSYGAPELAGCYCLPCAINLGLTAEQIERERYIQFAKQVRADTVREFAERLNKEATVTLCGTELLIPIAHSLVERIAKEMVEGKNGS